MIHSFEKPKLRALLALEDCTKAADLLDKCEDDTWRIYYIACVSLLRAVGHILSKVDAKKSQYHQQLIAKLWSDLKDNSAPNMIFWGFIEPERNSVLKQYLFSTNGFDQDAITYGPDLENDPSNFELYFVDTLKIPYYDPSTDVSDDDDIETPFPGHDVRDLVRDGICFWENKLNDLINKLDEMQESD